LPRRTVASAAALAVVFTLYLSAGAASLPIDLSEWTTYDQPNLGAAVPPSAWEIDDSGTVVVQEVNGPPTFFVAPGDMRGHRFTAALSSPGPDNDFFGLAVGFSTGPAAEYLLIDWRRGDQTIDWMDGVGTVDGPMGLAVSRVSGVATLGELWAHIDSPANPAGGVTELQRGDTLGSAGWAPGTLYEFVVEYTEGSLDVWVNGSHEISIAGDFPSGPVALYDFSEPRLSISGISIETLNDPPRLLDGGATDISVFEGEVGATSGAFMDPDGDELTLSCRGRCRGFSDTGGGNWEWSQLLREGPTAFDVGVRATDGEMWARDVFHVDVANVAPVITSTSGVSAPHDMEQTLFALVDFSDAGVLDTHTARYEWGDGSASAALIDEDRGAGTASGSHQYTEPGFYTISVTVWDDDGASDSAVLGKVFVFDPDTFVTGGGWVSSPAEAWTASPSHEGKATFGFNVRYDRSGSVRGNLEFQLHKGLNFHARSFDYLLVNDGVARFSGAGTVNGAPGYDIDVVATDERLADSTEDLFWIEITGPAGTVYDGGVYPTGGLPIVGKGIQVHDR
jgi:hypothetical protein